MKQTTSPNKAFINLCDSDDEEVVNNSVVESMTEENGEDEEIRDERSEEEHSEEEEQKEEEEEEEHSEEEQEEQKEEEEEHGEEEHSEEQEKAVKAEMKKMEEERGSFYYENGEVRGSYALCHRRSVTPTMPSYSPTYAPNEIPSYEQWVNMSKGERRMWEERGYTAYNGKVEVDPRSPKCWAINQRQYDSDEDGPSYSPSSPSYNPVPTHDDWVKMSKGERDIWEQRGYYASGGKIYLDERSPKSWAMNQTDNGEPSYSATSPRYNPVDHFTPSHSPRPTTGSAYADLLNLRNSGRYSPTAPCYSKTYQDASTSPIHPVDAEPQPIGNTADDMGASAFSVVIPKSKLAVKEVGGAERIMTRASRNQKNTVTEVAKLDAEIERLQKRKAEVLAAEPVVAKRSRRT